MNLPLPLARKLFAAIIVAIIGLLLLMIPINAIRIHDEFLRLMLSIAIASLIIYIFYIYRKALKEGSLRSIKQAVKKIEPDFVFPDEMGLKENGPDN